MTDDERASDRDFTPAERRALRRILQTQERTDWLWATLRVWAIWIGAIVGGLYAAGTILRDGLRALLGNGGGS